MKLMLYCNNYVKKIEFSSNMSKGTTDAYKYDVTAFVLFVGNQSIKKEIVLSYFESLMKHQYKPSTIIRKKVSVSLFLDYLKEIKYIKTNYLKDINIKIIKEKTLPKVIAIKEIKRILRLLEGKIQKSTTSFSYFMNVRNLALFDLIITTGIRISEASKIKVFDIDDSSRTIMISGKGRKERIVYISSEDCWEHIKKYIEIRRKIITNGAYLFLNKKHMQIGTHTIDSIFRKIIRTLKLPKNITPHCLRHTFATNLLANGADIRSVQELLGHSSILTTEIYTHVDINRKKLVLNKYNYRNRL